MANIFNTNYDNDDLIERICSGSEQPVDLNTMSRDEKIDYTCNCFEKSLSVYYLDHDLADRSFIYYIMVTSLVFEGLTVLYISNIKGLQVHPMKIYMMISVADFCFIWSLLSMTEICPYKMHDLLHKTAFWDCNVW